MIGFAFGTKDKVPAINPVFTKKPWFMTEKEWHNYQVENNLFKDENRPKQIHPRRNNK